MIFRYAVLVLPFIACALSFVIRDDTNSTSLELPSLLTANGSLWHPPPEFTTAYHALDRPVKWSSAYMNIINALCDQSQEDFRALIGLQTFSIAPWDDVRIRTTSITGRQIPRSFLIYGLYQTMQYYAVKRSVMVAMELRWNGVTEAEVIVEPVENRPSNAIEPLESSMPIVKNSPGRPVELNAVSKRAAGNLTNSAINVDIRYNNRPRTFAPFQGVFVVMAGALANIAEKNRQGEAMDYFKCSQPTFKITFMFDLTHVRPGAPTMTSLHAIAATWDLAKQLMESRDFRELTGAIELNGRLIGQLGLFKD